jgi:hypothetical protein
MRLAKLFSFPNSIQFFVDIALMMDYRPPATVFRETENQNQGRKIDDRDKREDDKISSPGARSARILRPSASDRYRNGYCADPGLSAIEHIGIAAMSRYPWLSAL